MKNKKVEEKKSIKFSFFIIFTYFFFTSLANAVELSERQKNYPMCLGWISQKMFKEGKYSLTSDEQELLNAPISKKIIQNIQSNYHTNGDYKLLYGTDRDIMMKYQEGRGRYIQYPKMYKGSELKAQIEVLSWSCILEEKQKKNISGIDYNKMLDFVSNRLLASQSTPSIGEFQLLSCMMNNMKPEYLSGTFLLDGMYDGGPRKDMYYKMKKIFDDMDNDILKMSVDCSSNINQFAR